ARLSGAIPTRATPIRVGLARLPADQHTVGHEAGARRADHADLGGCPAERAGVRIGLARKNTPACGAVTAGLAGTDPCGVRIGVSGCHYPVGPSGSPAPGTASAQVYLLPVMPTGPFRTAYRAYADDQGGRRRVSWSPRPAPLPGRGTSAPADADRAPFP